MISLLQYAKTVDRSVDFLEYLNLFTGYDIRSSRSDKECQEIYADNEIIWPNEKQHITNKELRPAHNLAKLVGCWYRYIKEGESV